MSFIHILSQIFALAACIVYLLVFLYILNFLVSRYTRFKSALSLAAVKTGVLIFTATMYTIMSSMGYGSSTFILPSHLFVIGLIWAEYYRGNKQNQNS